MLVQLISLLCDDVLICFTKLFYNVKPASHCAILMHLLVSWSRRPSYSDDDCRLTAMIWLHLSTSTAATNCTQLLLLLTAIALTYCTVWSRLVETWGYAFQYSGYGEWLYQLINHDKNYRIMRYTVYTVIVTALRTCYYLFWLVWEWESLFNINILTKKPCIPCNWTSLLLMTTSVTLAIVY